MIPFHALLNLLPPVALTLVRASLDTGHAPTGEFRTAVLEHFRQIKADLAGDPQVAELVYQIVNSTVTT